MRANMQKDEPPYAMAPAYGGMFRPSPRRRWPIAVAIVALLVIASAFAIRFYLHSRQRPVGVPCTMTAGVDNEAETRVGCNGGLCIRELDGETYCSQECSADEDCPAQFVCDPTRSGKRRACMQEGADVTPVSASQEDAAAPTRVFRRQRAH